MAVIRVKETWSGRTGKIDDKFVRTYNRTFRVVTDSSYDGGLTVRQAAGIPRVWDPYVDQNGAVDLGCFCRDVDAKQDSDNPFAWTGTAQYSSKLEDPAKQDQNPLLKPSVITWSFDSFQRPAINDINGNAIVNSAQEKFDPPPEMDDSRPKLTIERNEASFDPGLAFLYQDAINSDPFFGALPGQCKVFGINAKSTYENGIVFWAVTYDFHFRLGTYGWALRLLDAGYWQIVTGKRLRILDNAIPPKPVPSPALLDGHGHAAALFAAPEYLTFPIYTSLPFAAFGLP